MQISYVTYTYSSRDQMKKSISYGYRLQLQTKNILRSYYEDLIKHLEPSIERKSAKWVTH